MPQAHQISFHKDAHRITANFGGYGSGKTLTSREELEKQALASAKVKTFLDGVTVRKVIVVPGRLVNIVAN